MTAPIWPLRSILIGLALHTLLPNSIEYNVLSSNLGGETFSLHLIAISIIGLFSANTTRYPAGLLLFTAIISTSSIIAHVFGQGLATTGAATIATASIALPLLSCQLTKECAPNQKKDIQLFLWFFIVTISIQGITSLANSIYPITDQVDYLDAGEDFRQAFGTYRLGSTAAAANTSGCLLALCTIPCIKFIENNSHKWLLLFAIAAGILGYQSRSGALIFSISVIALQTSFSKKKLFLILALLGSLITVTSLLRDTEEASTSNAYRLLLALEVIDLTAESDLQTALVGRGPGEGINRALNNYYGVAANPPRQLLTSSESAALVFALEFGVFGIAIFALAGANLAGKSPLIALTYLSYLALDPSALRFYEALLTGIFLGLATISKTRPTESTLNAATKKFNSC